MYVHLQNDGLLIDKEGGQKMAETTKLHDVLADMANHLDGAWIIAVSDNEGILLSSWESPDNKLSPDVVAGQFIKILRNLNGTLSEAGAATGFTGLEDVVLTTGFSYLLVKPICQGACYLIIDSSRDVPLGMLRLVTRNYAAKLEQTIPSGQ